MTKRFLCVGRVYADLVFRSAELPHWGQEVFCEDFHAVAGGGAFITAAYLRQLGHDVQLAGVAGGAPPFGDIIRQSVTRCGLDDRSLRYSCAAQTTVAIAGASDRAFLTQKAPEPVTIPEQTEFDHLHIGELSSLLECPGLIDLARRQGASVSADCGDQGTYPSEAQNLLEQLDVFLPNEGETQSLKAAGVSLAKVARVVVKQGAKGASTGGLSVPAHPTAVVDTTGAGDAFNAGFLDGWISGTALDDALRRGVALGAQAVSRMGGFGDAG